MNVEASEVESLMLKFEHYEQNIPIAALMTTVLTCNHVNSTVEQLREAKAKMQILLTKSINDDLLIQALTIELAAARQVTILLSPSFLWYR